MDRPAPAPAERGPPLSADAFEAFFSIQEPKPPLSADTFEALFPAQEPGPKLLAMLTLHALRDDYDDEDICTHSERIFTWIQCTEFCRETHPRMWAMGVLSQQYMHMAELSEHGMRTLLVPFEQVSAHVREKMK